MPQKLLIKALSRPNYYLLASPKLSCCDPLITTSVKKQKLLVKYYSAWQTWVVFNAPRRITKPTMSKFVVAILFLKFSSLEKFLVPEYQQLSTSVVKKGFRQSSTRRCPSLKISKNKKYRGSCSSTQITVKTSLTSLHWKKIKVQCSRTLHL